VDDAVRGCLQDRSAAADEFGQPRKPDLADYPKIPWESLDIDQFNRVPGFMRWIMKRLGIDWETFHIIPIESGRGCPYGCEFCTVTGFFGGSIRFRSNESIVDELLRLKARAAKSRGQIAVFFVDDNFAINVKRTKSLLRDIIAAGAQVTWIAQISANLLRDEELVELIADSGGKWIFIGMESLDPVNLAAVNKGFSKPDEYGLVLERLARRNVYAITSFIFGLDNDRPGVGARTLSQLEKWAPGLPVFGQITPFPATPFYARLEKEGRLTRPKHWLEFTPFRMAHTPRKMTAAEVQADVRYAWTHAYSPAAARKALDALRDQPAAYKISHFVARLFFRNIYFPQKGAWGWTKLVAWNWRPLVRVIYDSFTKWHGSPKTVGNAEGACPPVSGFKEAESAEG